MKDDNKKALAELVEVIEKLDDLCEWVKISITIHKPNSKGKSEDSK